MEGSQMNKHMIKTVTVAIFLGLLLVATPGRSEETRTLTTIRGETVVVPDVVPDRRELDPLGMLVVAFETPIGKGGLIVALYDNPNSQRLGDYVETYDLAGNLLEITWYDEGGQVKAARDKNLTNPGARGPAKILVMGAEPRFIVQSPPLRHF